MANLTFNGKRLLFPNGGILDYTFIETLYQLFTFDTDGTTLNNLQVGGTSLDSSNNSLWDFGDTTTDDTINSNFSHTYTGVYESPAEKTVTFSLLNPSDATILKLYGDNTTIKNNITSIDISNFTSLETFDIRNNNISSLDLSNNINLLTIDISNNNISSLDLSNNPDLTTLYANDTNLSSIDVNNNPDLTTLYANDTNLSSIDVNNNPDLTTLYANGTNIETVDISNNTLINIVSATNTPFTGITFDTGATYPNLQGLYFYNCGMTSQVVNDMVDTVWGMRDNLTSGSKLLSLTGNNAELSFESTHKVLWLIRDYNFIDGGAPYNIPDNIMKFGWSSSNYNNNINNYYMLQSENSPVKATIMGNSISSLSETIDLEWKIYVNTNLTDFQSSSVSWRVRVSYRKHWSDSWISVNNTLYTLTGNTNGFELLNTISLSNVSGINGTDSFGIQNQITLTDNRFDKTQDTGDYMIVRVVPSISSDITSGVVPYPYGERELDFTRTKWGD
jgi:hypothetical protein